MGSLSLMLEIRRKPQNATTEPRRASKISGLFAGIRQDHLLGLLWFDVAQHSGLYHQDWRLKGHPAAMAAFRRGLASMSKA